MVRAFGAVWRYRWDIAPFLLASAAQAFPSWFVAVLHDFGVLSAATRTLGRAGWQALYPGDAVWFLSGVVGIALLFVLLRHGICRLEALGRPVTKTLWEALLLALGVSLLASAGWRALNVTVGFGVWWDFYLRFYPWLYYLVLLSIVGWAVRALWNREAATALFVVIAAIIVVGSGASGRYIVHPEPGVLWLDTWLPFWAVVAAQLLPLVLGGALAYNLSSQPTWRQWLMTGALLTAASAALVVTSGRVEVFGSTSLPFWFGYVWDPLGSGDALPGYAPVRYAPLQVVPSGVAVAANLAHVYAVAALAFVASFGFHTLHLRRHPAASEACPPTSPPSEER